MKIDISKLKNNEHYFITLDYGDKDKVVAKFTDSYIYELGEDSVCFSFIGLEETLWFDLKFEDRKRFIDDDYIIDFDYESIEDKDYRLKGLEK